MKKLLLFATTALLMVQSADAAYAQYGPPRYAPYGPRPHYAYRYQEPRGPNPLDFFGALFGAIPMIAGAIPPPPPYYQPPPDQVQTQYDPRDPNLYLEEYRVTKQEVEAAMRIFCSEHRETVICQKIENMMRQRQRER